MPEGLLQWRAAASPGAVLTPCSSPAAAIVDGEVKQVGCQCDVGLTDAVCACHAAVRPHTRFAPAVLARRPRLLPHPPGPAPAPLQVSLEDYRSKYVALFFYPKDFT